MKLITKKNISVALALLMATCIITSAKADPKEIPAKRTAVFVHSAELVEFVDEYFDELEVEMEALEAEVQTIKLFDSNDEVLFEGLQEDMDEETSQLFNKAEYLSEMAGAEYYKILH